MNPETSTGFAHFIAQSDAVGKSLFAILVLMSAISWGVILVKGVSTQISRRRGTRFLDLFWNATSLDAVAHEINTHGAQDPFSHLASHAMHAKAHHARYGASKLEEAGTASEFVTRTIKKVLDEETTRMENGLTFLATVGATAPFVGLFGTVWGVYHALVAIGMSGAGIGREQNQSVSVTQAGISGMAGLQTARTGDTQLPLGRIFDKDKVKDSVTAQVLITQEFGKQASKLVGERFNAKTDEIKSQARKEMDPVKRQELLDEAAKWDEGGRYRVLAHGLVGGLTGGAQGATGSGVSQLAVPEIGNAIKQLDMPLEAKQTLIAVVGMATGAATGGAPGASAATNATLNNFLSRPQLLERNKALAVLREDSSKGFIEKLFHPVTGLLDASNSLLAIDYMDKRSDALLAVYRENPLLLSAAEKRELAIYLGAYAKAEGDLAAISLLDKGVPSGLEAGDKGQLVLRAQSLVKLNAEHEGRGVIGTPALQVMTGPVGMLARAVMAAQSSLQVGAGLSALKDGDAAGLADVGFGVLGLWLNRQIESTIDPVQRPVKKVVSRADADALAAAQAAAKLENQASRDGSNYYASKWQELKGQTDAVRQQLPDMVDANIGNAAVAEINVYGEGSTRVQAHSRIGNDPQSVKDGFVSLPPPEQRILKPLEFPNRPIPREFDTEYKILENFAQQHKSNPQVQGSINLFTERPPCDSCTDVIKRQFTQLYPNVEVRLYHNNGEITVFTGSGPTTGKVPSRNEARWPASPDLPKPPAQKKGR